MPTIDGEFHISEARYLEILREQLQYNKTSFRPGQIVRLVTQPTDETIARLIPAGSLGIVQHLLVTCACPFPGHPIAVDMIFTNGRWATAMIHDSCLEVVELENIDKPWAVREMPHAAAGVVH